MDIFSNKFLFTRVRNNFLHLHPLLKSKKGVVGLDDHGLRKSPLSLYDNILLSSPHQGTMTDVYDMHLEP